MHSLMGSETQVVQLQELLEATEVEAAGMERELDDYEAVLHRARIARAPVSEKSASLETANRNNRLLIDEMSHLVVSSFLVLSIIFGYTVFAKYLLSGLVSTIYAGTHFFVSQ